ncbi:hypothetical protein J6590_103635, partial [Homalodisca vitripennis]
MDLRERRSSSGTAQTISLADQSSSQRVTAQSSQPEVAVNNTSVEVVDSVLRVSSPTEPEVA